MTAIAALSNEMKVRQRSIIRLGAAHLAQTVSHVQCIWTTEDKIIWFDPQFLDHSKTPNTKRITCMRVYWILRNSLSPWEICDWHLQVSRDQTHHTVTFRFSLDSEHMFKFPPASLRTKLYHTPFTMVRWLRWLRWFCLPKVYGVDTR